MKKILISFIAFIISFPAGVLPIGSAFAQTSATETGGLKQVINIGGPSGRSPKIRGSLPVQNAPYQPPSNSNDLNETFIATLLSRIALLQDDLAKCRAEKGATTEQFQLPPTVESQPVVIQQGSNVQQMQPTIEAKLLPQPLVGISVQPQPTPTPQPDQNPPVRNCVLPQEVQSVLSSCSAGQASVSIYSQNTGQTYTVSGQSSCTLERLRSARGLVAGGSECDQSRSLIDAAIQVAERERQNALALEADRARQIEIENQRIAAEKERLAREQMAVLAQAERQKAATVVQETIGAALRTFDQIRVCYYRRISTDVEPIFARAVQAGVPLTDPTLSRDLPKLRADIQAGITNLENERLRLIQEADQFIYSELSGAASASQVQALLSSWLQRVRQRVSELSEQCDNWRLLVLQVARQTVEVAESLQTQSK